MKCLKNFNSYFVIDYLIYNYLNLKILKYNLLIIKKNQDYWVYFTKLIHIVCISENYSKYINYNRKYFKNLLNIEMENKQLLDSGLMQISMR